MQIDPEVRRAVDRFEIPEKIIFGETKIPAMYLSSCEGSRWSEGVLEPYRRLQIDPAAKVLHYAVEAFEGLKAYRGQHNRPHLFRPERNWQRLNNSLARLSVPPLPEDIFFEGINALADISAPLIPAEPGCSLYLRPFVIGTHASLGLPAAAQEYLFIVIASPAGAYQATPMKIFVERESARAVPGGTGAIKIGGNYATSISSDRRAAERGLSTTLWLDATQHRYVEELSGMNIFFAIDGALHTPALTDSILPGVTRDSLIRLAADFGIPVFQRQIAIEEIVEGIQQGSVRETFACGTAVTVLAIERFVEACGTVHVLPECPGPMGQRLKTALLNIQEGRSADPYRWTREVPALTS